MFDVVSSNGGEVGDLVSVGGEQILKSSFVVLSDLIRGQSPGHDDGVAERLGLAWSVKEKRNSDAEAVKLSLSMDTKSQCRMRTQVERCCFSSQVRQPESACRRQGVGMSLWYLLTIY